MASRELQHLLKVLKGHNIALGRDDVAWAFESGSTAGDVSAWVREYLSPHSLLTREELHFYEKHEGSIRGGEHDRPSGRPVSDAEFESAISSLEASTAAIDEQCQILEAQKQAFQDLKARQSGNDGEGHAESHQKRLAREKAQLDFDISDLSDSLSSRLYPQARQSDVVVSGFPSAVGRVLEKDDRLLDGLQKLLPKLDSGNNSDDRLADIDKLCQALTILSGREIRARIDAAFLKGAQSNHVGQSNGHRDESEATEQRDSLRAELEELLSEIDGLVSMAVTNQFHTPIMRDLQAAEAEDDHERAQWGEYVLLALQYLTDRLDVIEEHCRHLHAHQEAVTQVSNAFKSVATPPVNSTREAQQAVRSPSTPTAKGLKPLRLVQASLAEQADPTAQLLRHFDIRVNDTSDTVKLSVSVARTEEERRTRLVELTSSTEQSVSDQLVETLAKAGADVQDLLGAVFAHSKFGTVRLVDEDVQTAVDCLEAKTQSIGEEMRKLDVDEIGRVVKMKQRQLME